VDRRAAALTCLILVGAVLAADEQWELWEELVPANAPIRMRLIDRFPSSEACQSRALQLSETEATPSERRLGFTCLPATPPAPAAS
jgi:hypothetical protein